MGFKVVGFDALTRLEGSLDGVAQALALTLGGQKPRAGLLAKLSNLVAQGEDGVGYRVTHATASKVKRVPQAGH